MKFRNKNTGDIVDAQKIGFELDQSNECTYDSLAELNEEWEDYELKEPLIKDEKIRKAVRAWAEVNKTKYVWVSVALKGVDITQDEMHLQLTEYKQSITFECDVEFKSGYYTIDELCGEEDE